VFRVRPASDAHHRAACLQVSQIISCLLATGFEIAVNGPQRGCPIESEEYGAGDDQSDRNLPPPTGRRWGIADQVRR
jgi:hypothetical protein